MKPPSARACFIVGMLLFVSGNFLLCYCPWWFVCAGLAFGCTAVFGSTGWRIAGIGFSVASFAVATADFRHERAAFEKAKETARKSTQ
jgi:membrane protein implicated in regulation of membrane protease activity